VLQFPEQCWKTKRNNIRTDKTKYLFNYMYIKMRNLSLCQNVGPDSSLASCNLNSTFSTIRWHRVEKKKTQFWQRLISANKHEQNIILWDKILYDKVERERQNRLNKKFTNQPRTMPQTTESHVGSVSQSYDTRPRNEVHGLHSAVFKRDSPEPKGVHRRQPGVPPMTSKSIKITAKHVDKHWQ